MRLLIDSHIFDSKHQGTRTYLKGLYSELFLIAKDWHFFMVATDVDNLEKEFGVHQNVTYLELKKKNKFYRLLIELPKIIKLHKIDYAHYQYISPPIKNCKQIITLHDILFEQEEFQKYFPLKYRLVNGFLFRTSAKRADILLTVSEYSKKRLSEKYNIEKDAIKITPNAVNVKELHENLLSNDKPLNFGKYILYVSRVEPRKNHLGLIKAFVGLDLVSKGYKLIFIGKKDILFKDLKDYIQKQDSKINESILWLEDVSDFELSAYYKNCELFVFPSFAEGFGIPPLEAMAFNKKVLCSNTTAMMDFGLPKELTFDPNNVEDIKNKIYFHLNNDFNVDSINNKILAKYDWKVIAENYKNIVLNHNKNLKY